MIEPRSLTIQGFKSYSRKTKFAFSRKRGLFLITGKNLMKPRLGGNAVGKSSLWDALLYCLYDKTARGLRGPSVKSWQCNENTSVSFTFRAGRKQFLTVRRTYKPNTLTLRKHGAQPERISQEQLERIIGCNYEAFLLTVLMGQFNKYFFDLTASQKLELFSSALNLNKWVDAAKRATQMASFKTQALLKLEGRQATHLAVVDELTRSIVELKADIAEFRRTKQVHVDEIQEALDKDQAEFDLLRIQEGKLSDKVNWVESKAEDYEKDLNRIEGERQKVKDAINQHREAVKACKRDMSQIDDKINDLQALKGDCPTCGQGLTKQAVAPTVKRWDVDWQFVETEKVHALRGLRRAKEALAALDDEANEADVTLGLREDHLAKLRKRATGLRERRNALKAKIDWNTAQLGKVTQTDADKLRARLRKAINRRRIKKARALRVVRTCRKLTWKRSLLEYWGKGFRQLRLWLIDRLLLKLQISVNSALVDLGLDDWTVSFDVQRETQAGTMSRGFHVFVKSPENETAVPWESWSGGETQRLRIAGAIGMAELIREQTQSNFDLDVFDEPTAFLSEEGIADLIDYFARRVKRTSRSTYLVDHRAFAHVGFDDRFIVTRDESGSSVARAVIGDLAND